MNFPQRVLCIGVALALALPVAATAATAQNTNVDPIELLAQASGLTTRQVQMVLGNRSSFAEYLTSYDFAVRRLQRAVGPKIYRHLQQDNELSAREVQDLIVMARAKTGEKVVVQVTQPRADTP